VLVRNLEVSTILLFFCEHVKYYLIVLKTIIEKDDHFYIKRIRYLTIIFIFSSINDFKVININKIMLIRHPITARTKILCVIGHPIEHSMSPIMHNAIIQDLGLDFAYVAFDVRPENLKGAVEGFRALNVIGINVTIPHKETIINYLDEMDDVAQHIGAVNTIKNDDGNLIGRNTDGEGGKKALMDASCQISGKNFLILGAGGAAKALCYSLAKDSNKIVIANRTEERAVKLAKEVKEQLGVNIEGKINNKRILKDELNKADVLINTTPIGMYPNVDNTPVTQEF
jgi:shikimate dehydrogenase